MELTEDQMFEKFSKLCGHRSRNTLLHMNMKILVFRADNVIKRKHELSKIQRKNTIYIIRLNYAEGKKFAFA